VRTSDSESVAAPKLTTIRTLALAALVYALAPIPPLHAETPADTLVDYAITTWTEKEGLPAGRIRTIEIADRDCSIPRSRQRRQRPVITW